MEACNDDLSVVVVVCYVLALDSSARLEFARCLLDYEDKGGGIVDLRGEACRSERVSKCCAEYLVG